MGEKEEAKVLRKKNQTRLANILDQMTKVDHRTTWEQCQQMLLDNPAFADDDELLAMDKEDALVAFEDHIRELEKEEEIEKDKEKKRTKRLQRKNRDAMNAVLDELHEQGKLTSMSLWMELYPVISQDPRFHALLGQPGSTPLDLFKFYVEELKARFHDEKKIIKEILKEKEFDMVADTSFEEFATIVCEDKRSASLDAGNVKLTYNALQEKAESKDKERIKEETKKLRKLEGDLRGVFTEINVEETSSWAEVMPKIEDKDAFKAVTEAQAEKMFKDYQKDLGETCLHNHGKKKKKKKKARAKSVSESRSPVSSEAEDSHRRKRRKGTPSLSPSPARRAASPMRSASPPSRSRRGRDSASPSRRKQRSQSDESIEEGELSEDELERKRMQLLKQLQEDD